MKRHNSVKVVSEEILKSGLAEAVFLKGSIARGEDDDFSDVDMYAVVTSENFDTFLAKRIQYLEKYKRLIYWCEENFVAPQIVGVFEDALHFDLYTVKPNSIPQTDDIKIIFDKSGVLDSYKKSPLGVSSDYITKEIDEFAFILLEFDAAYARKDYIWAITLFHIQLSKTSLITRFIFDSDNAQLRLKRIHKVIPNLIYNEYVAILESATPTNILSAMKSLVLLTDKLMSQLPDEMQTKVNTEFFNMMKNKITVLE